MGRALSSLSCFGYTAAVLESGDARGLRVSEPTAEGAHRTGFKAFPFRRSSPGSGAGLFRKSVEPGGQNLRAGSPSLAS